MPPPFVDGAKPVAALVSVADLQHIEGQAEAPIEEDKHLARQAHYRRLMEEAGLVVQWPTGDPVPRSAYQPIEIKGQPLSEQILADRR